MDPSPCHLGSPPPLLAPPPHSLLTPVGADLHRGGSARARALHVSRAQPPPACQVSSPAGQDPLFWPLGPGHQEPEGPGSSGGRQLSGTSCVSWQKPAPLGTNTSKPSDPVAGGRGARGHLQFWSSAPPPVGWGLCGGSSHPFAVQPPGPPCPAGTRASALAAARLQVANRSLEPSVISSKAWLLAAHLPHPVS